ncbi:UDP-xylose and UDP-N-acetylglucosamine transporter-like protein [Euroglyphus maynei]|uniref:UDP-xylose and UDP-N-acetylglucosamine transporter-like protein n=1 Tax=Euroglyphus maynei TaxID=6958 RepID=A0A1Y3BLA3_EURMA|nr:UDP-xylose and UDP-N-acetylglucosamine transporter-like protein [Euroglyphus maynei]
MKNIGRKSFEWHKAWLMIKCTTFCFITMALNEQTLRLAPKSSNFISFIQHMFITICGLLTIGLPFGFGVNRPQVPTRYYLPLVFLSFFTIFTNNLSLNFGISIPLMMIFKSSSLVANMLLGMLILRHRYSLNKFLSVIAITIGLILCTIEDYRLKHSLNYMDIFSLIFQSNDQSSSTISSPSTWTTTIGITLLTASFLSSAALGIYQEFLAKKFGKNSNEALFYVHLLSIPIFLITSTSDIYSHFHLIVDRLVESDVIFFDLPTYLLMTVLTQYLCIRSVYRLTTECSSLSVTLCLTNRKFLSLLFSIFYFGNPFTIWHWNGAFIVFGGTISFYLIDAIRHHQSESSMMKKSN